MNIAGFLHIPDSRYCFAESDHELTIRLRVAKEDANLPISLVFGNKYHYQFEREEKKLSVRYIDHTHAYFEVTLKLSDVRLAYIFKIQDQGKTYYFSEDGITEDFDFSVGFYNFFQMPYINPADIHRRIEWTKSSVFYQIFVDRFYQGDERKDTSYIDMAWGELPKPKSFAGGDLEGIRQKLDYLQRLGVNTLYLTPIFKSISNHKYDIYDYYAVDAQFGSSVSLKALIDQAHGMGMHVILDAVFNHASDRISIFQDVIDKGRASRYFDWFMIDGDAVNQEVVNYETFAACSYMPKWNTSNPAVQAYLIDVGLYWIREFDIDGWRLDVSDEVSHDFWRQFRRAVKAEKPDAVLIGENWHDAYPYLMGDQYDGIMNYAFTKACLNYFATGNCTAQEMSEKLNNILMRNTTAVNQMNLNLLDSHDTHRFFTQVGESKEKLLAATALLMTFVGIPCLYYGTEIAMAGGYDPDCRRCMNWKEEDWDKDFLEIIRQLIQLRKENIIQDGTTRIYGQENLLRVVRQSEDEQIILLINQSAPSPVKVENILISHLYEDGQLLNNGFVIYKQNRKD